MNCAPGKEGKEQSAAGVVLHAAQVLIRCDCQMILAVSDTAAVILIAGALARQAEGDPKRRRHLAAADVKSPMRDSPKWQGVIAASGAAESATAGMREAAPVPKEGTETAE